MERVRLTESLAGDGTRITALDGVRGAATAIVVIYHLEMSIPIPGDRVLPGGFAGLDVFFALSGFLITSQLLAYKHRTGRLGIVSYVAKRATRILPLLAIFLAVAALYEWTIGTSANNILWTTVANFFFLPGSVLANLDFTLAFSTWHLWSLIVEVHFYILIPFLVAGFLQDRRPWWLAAGSLAALVLVVGVNRHALVGDVSPLELYARTTARIDALLIGAGAALLHRRTSLDARCYGVAGWVGLVLVAAWALTIENTSLWLFQGGFTVVALASSALVLAVATSSGPSAHFERWPWPAIGRISYGIYLWHALVILAVARWLHWLPWPVQAAAALGITLGLALLSWHYVEQPALAMLRRWLDRRRARTSAAAAPAPVPDLLEPLIQPETT